MSHQLDPGRVVVPSSGVVPVNSDDWQELPYRHVLEVRRSNLRVSTHFVPERAAIETEVA